MNGPIDFLAIIFGYIFLGSLGAVGILFAFVWLIEKDRK